MDDLCESCQARLRRAIEAGCRMEPHRDAWDCGVCHTRVRATVRPVPKDGLPWQVLVWGALCAAGALTFAVGLVVAALRLL